MSNYGPPGGPYAGPPQEPWPGRQPQDPYGQPSGPWGGHEPWGAGSSTPQDGPSSAPGYGPSSTPAYGQGYDPRYDQGGHREHGYDDAYPSARPYDPGYGQAVAPSPVREPAVPVSPPKKRALSTPVLTLIVVLALLVLGGGTGFYLMGRSDPTPVSQPTTSPTGSATTDATPTAQPAGNTPGPRSSTDARFVTIGQCVKNEGSGGKPKLTIAECASKTYEVMARFDGATNGEADAKSKCAKVQGYTDWYFYNSELDVLDFVLCLKQR